ncbi:hypothetical protein SAMD00019534_028650 [Acytostelium subglobosum LB1]|uniref:hypothetical protein n=1 Tax=Acytostelium subglobosum LB1 TaxID=1410327 RepID=UPI00064482FC|nr:hypothetical protein SAMD00019534_028650 [Acytostelium subglobosum LB1]GAM19690.1 hypothetical protein SAMD00019534_028650 [Acytostelium subglobosum LB1]|eukprot:XP_012756452.1 hypothetical protein SAMD00019534_028650 [Acytostelium subglobosum LB1]
MSNRVLVIDNGAHTLKIAHAPATGSEPAPIPVVVPNQVGKTKSEKKYIVADELNKPQHATEIKLRGPMEKGYITNWSVQKEIWDHVFKMEELKVKPADTSLLLTEAPFDLEEIRKSLYETVYEQYKFKSLCLASPTTLALTHFKASEPPSSPFISSPCHLVVDCGYSFTHVVPHLLNNRLNYAIKRFQVGGKLMTNYLKEIVSFRYWDMMHETRLLNTIKERVCYVSHDFLGDLAKCQPKPKESALAIDYVLPDYINDNTTGYIKNKAYFPQSSDDSTSSMNNVQQQKQQQQQTSDQQQQPDKKDDEQMKEQKDEEQILTLVNERFSVPELLFNPSDIGLNQAGLAESIVQSINSTNINLHQPLYSNILLIGGSTRLPGLKDRLYQELRAMTPDHLTVKIYTPEDPVLAPLQGGLRFAQQSDFHRYTVTKKEYEEHGYVLCNRRFY